MNRVLFDDLVFLFVGQTMWGFFNKNVVQSVKMIKRNKGIVSKVYIPKFVLLLSNMMVNGVKMGISWIIVLIMLFTSGVGITPYVIWYIPILIVLILTTFAVSINLMHFGVFIEDLGNVINIVIQLLFFMSGIMYNIENRLGAQYPLAAKIMTYGNPIALSIRDMRNILLYNQAPDIKVLGIWALVAVVFSAIGVRTIYKNENSYVKVI